MLPDVVPNRGLWYTSEMLEMVSMKIYIKGTVCSQYMYVYYIIYMVGQNIAT